MPLPRSWLIRLLFVVLCFPLPFGFLKAQYYPVQGTLQVKRPYSLYLNDYALPSREALVVSLTNRDIQHPTLQVRLRFRIKNSACLVQTRDEHYLSPFSLEVNFPVRLTSSELQEYFHPDALGGYGLRGDKLPDGYTEFAVQVVDAFSGLPLSDWITTTLFLESLKPPELILPQDHEQIAYRTPQRILFQWYPRHQAQSRTTYEFVLKELPDNGAPASAAFAYGIEVYRTECHTPFFEYTGYETYLSPHRRYAWQVHALLHDGGEALGIFENDGYSQVFSFTLTENCPAPQYLKSNTGYARADLSWRVEPRARGYVVAYRPKSAKDDFFEWKTEEVSTTNFTLRGLRLGWTYQWRVGILCSGDTPVYSPLSEFTLSTQNETLLANCGKRPPDAKPLSATPKLDLAVGDQVIIGGDFPMRITSLTNLGDGWYSGRGTTEIRAIISVSNIALRFDRLRVNTDGYQIDGTVESVYDSSHSTIANTDLLDDGGHPLRHVELRLREHRLNFPLPANPTIHYNPTTQQLEIEDEHGAVHHVPLDIPQNEQYKSIFLFVLTDSEGHRYSLTPEDDNSQSSSAPNAPANGKQRLVVQRLERVGLFNGNKLVTEYGTMRFTRGNGIYAFDDGTTATKYFLQGSTKLDSYYTPLAKGYTVPWKLVPVGTSDVVEAFFESKKRKPIDPKLVKFVQVTGETLPTQYDSVNALWRINLPSVSANESYDLFALLGGDLVGKLRVVSYPQQTHRVTLVTLSHAPAEENSTANNAIDVEGLQRALNTIYAPVGVQFTVDMQTLRLPSDATWDLDGDGSLSLEGISFFGKPQDVKESAEMLALQRLFKEYGNYHPNERYLFVLPSSKSSDKQLAVLGDMPRGSQFGYLFTGTGKRALDNNELSRLVAHELGHGLFTLQHTFDAEYGNKRSKGKTDNLMDYASGTALLAFQWNILSSPALFTTLDKAEEGRLLKPGSVFLTPDWRPFVCDAAHILSNYTNPSNNRVTNGVVGVIYLDSGQKRYSYREHDDRLGYYDEDGKPLAGITYPTLSDADSVYVINYRDSTAKCGMIYRMRWGDIKELRANDLFASHTSPARTPIKALHCATEWDSLRSPNFSVHFTQRAQQYSTALFGELEAAVNRQAALTLKKPFKRPLFYFLLEEDTVNFDSLRRAHPNELVIFYTVAFNKGKLYITNLSSTALKQTPKQTEQILIDFYKTCKQPIDSVNAVIYTVLDLLTRGFENAKIPESVWACDDANNILKQAVTICYSILCPSLLQYRIKNDDWSNNFEFAFACGLWDGLIETLGGSPELAKTLHPLLTFDPVDGYEMLLSFREMVITDENGTILCDSTEYLCKIRELYGQLLNNIDVNRCDVAHFAGTMVVPIVITIWSRGQAKGVLISRIGNLSEKLNWTLRNVFRFLKWCDDYGDVMTYVKKLSRPRVRLIKTSKGELLSELQLDGKVLVKSTGGQHYKMARKRGKEVDYIDSESLDEVDEQVAKLLKQGEDVSTVDIDAIVRCLPSVTQDLLDAIRSLSDDLRALLLRDLETHSKRESLKKLLVTPNDIKIWAEIKAEPQEAFKKFKTYQGSNKADALRWVRSEYAKKVFNNGQQFGRKILNDLKDKMGSVRKKLGELLHKDLSDYEVYDEVQLFIDGTNGEYMKADVVLVKWDAKRENVIDFIVVENKISPKSPYSDNQKQFFYNVLKMIKEDEIATIDIRSNMIKKSRKEIIKEIKLERIDLVKITGEGSESIENLEKIAVERILHIDL